MSSAAWTAWRSFFCIIGPALWFSTATAHPRGLTMRGSSAGRALTRS